MRCRSVWMAKEPQGLVAVCLRGKERPGAHPALDDVMGRVGNDDASQPRHTGMGDRRPTRVKGHHASCPPNFTFGIALLPRARGTERAVVSTKTRRGTWSVSPWSLIADQWLMAAGFTSAIAISNSWSAVVPGTAPESA